MSKFIVAKNKEPDPPLYNVQLVFQHGDDKSVSVDSCWFTSEGEAFAFYKKIKIVSRIIGDSQVFDTVEAERIATALGMSVNEFYVFLYKHYQADKSYDEMYIARLVDVRCIRLNGEPLTDVMQESPDATSEIEEAIDAVFVIYNGVAK